MPNGQKSVEMPAPSTLGSLWSVWLRKRRRDRARALSHVRFRLTREGVHYVGILLFIFLGALLRDINLLILLAGAMIGLLLLQWRFNTRTLVGLTAKRYLPRHTFVGQSTEVEVRLSNPKHWLGAWLVLVEDPLHKLLPAPWRISGKGTTVVDEVPPRGVSAAKYQLTFHQRGSYTVGPTTLSTRFPLSLGRGARTLDNATSIMVLPQLGQLSPRARQLFRAEQQGSAQAAQAVGSQEADFYGLRPWATGDSKRWIHWRTTARQGELSVRQFERQQRQHTCVLLDLAGTPRRKNEVDEEVEFALSFLATLVSHTARHGTDRLAVGVAAATSFSLPSVQGGVLVENLLERLATVLPSPQPDLLVSLQGMTVQLLSSPHLLVISTRADQSQKIRELVQTALASRLVTRLQITWLDVTRGDAEPYFSWT